MEYSCELENAKNLYLHWGGGYPLDSIAVNSACGRFGVPETDLTELLNLYYESLGRMGIMKLPKFKAGWWVRFKDDRLEKNRGVIINYCGFFAKGEFAQSSFPRADKHGSISGHIYHIERHSENWIEEFRDYYAEEDALECDI